MRRAILTATVFLGAFASGAFAADVAVHGTLAETLEGSDNYFLQNSPSGTTFKSLSTVNVDVLARTPGWRFLLASNFAYYNYFGDGAEATNPTSGTAIHETFRVDHATDLATYFFMANYNRADVAATQLRETGFVTGTGAINTFRATGGATHDLNRADSLSWSATATRVTFTDDPGQTPFSDLGAYLAWNHLLSPTTTITTSVNFDWLNADDIANSQRLFWQIMTGVKSQLTRRLTVTASVGAAFANAWQNNAIVVPVGTPTFIQPGAASSWVGIGAVNYQLLRSTNVTLTASQVIAPTSFGQLQKTTAAGLIVSYDINAWSNLAFLARFAHTKADVTFASTDADFFSAGVAYSYQLARDWRTRLSYTYRQRNDDTGTAQSSTVLLSLAYDFNLMGNPRALDPVERERAFIRQQQAVGEVFPTVR